MAQSRGRLRIVAPSLKDEIKYLDRLENEPTAKTQVELNAILDSAFFTSQAFVHVLSGRLRSTGRKMSSTKRTARGTTWLGEIEYGRGLDYGKYEFGNKGVRESWPLHPSHDPYDGLETYYFLVDQVIDGIF